MRYAVLCQKYPGFLSRHDPRCVLYDARTIRAVAFEFTTIGEAARVIPVEIQERFSDIPWSKMQGIRNVLIHEYFRLDEEILWKAVQEDIPPLIMALGKIIESEGR